MSLFVLASASGAPGVTTTALGLALSWPRPVVLVDADPVGGSPILAGYFRGAVEHPDAMVRLVLAMREGRLREVLPSVLIGLGESSPASLLVGPRSAVQASNLRELWPALLPELHALDEAGQDVLVDLGRLAMSSSAVPLLEGADCALLVTRSDLPSLSAARQWGIEWAAASRAGAGASWVGCLVLGPGRPYSAREVGKVVGLPVVESIPWDEKAASRLSQGTSSGRRGVGRLERSYVAAGAAVRALMAPTQPSVSAEGRAS